MLAYVHAFDLTTIPWGTQLQATLAADGVTWSTYLFPQDGDPLGTFLAWPTNTQYVTGLSGSSCEKILWFDIDGGYMNGMQVSKCQVYLPIASPYYVFAYGAWLTPAGQGGPDCTCASGGTCYECGANGMFLSQGCIGTAGSGPMIIDLGVPNQGFDTDVLIVSYVFGLIDPSATLEPFCSDSGGPAFYDRRGLAASFGNFGTTQPSLGFRAAFPAACSCNGPLWEPGQACGATTADPFGFAWP